MFSERRGGFLVGGVVLAASGSEKPHEIVVWRTKSHNWRREWESNPRFSIIPRRTAETNLAIDPSGSSVRAGSIPVGANCGVRNGIGVPAAGSPLFIFVGE